jgi:Fur family ferric uptake transcriptional regulator
MVPLPPADLQQAWRDAIHAAGGRVTPQREALLAAVWRLRHATAESLAAELARSDDSVSLSTVYRGLEALEAIGLVRHAHLGAGGPTYHIAAEAHHIHLQCNTCGRVISLATSVADGFVAAIAQRTGFAADVTHAAVYGRCAQCAKAGEDGA